MLLVDEHAFSKSQTFELEAKKEFILALWLPLRKLRTIYFDQARNLLD